MPTSRTLGQCKSTVIKQLYCCVGCGLADGQFSVQEVAPNI
jgi:hypothetical protein